MVSVSSCNPASICDLGIQLSRWEIYVFLSWKKDKRLPVSSWSEHLLVSDKALTIDYVSFLIVLFIEALVFPEAQSFDLSSYDMNIAATPIAP